MTKLSELAEHLTDDDQERAARIVRAFEVDTPRMMRSLLRITRGSHRWPWRFRKRWMDEIRHVEARRGW